jgi:hypothetical protein
MMPMRTMLKSIGACVLVAVSAFAADVTGKWTGDVPGRGGEATPSTFTFKVDGEKLTGTMTGPQGDVQIQDGKISGDNLSFSTTLEFGGNSIKLLYKGAVSGQTIKMTREREGSGQPREFTIKRAAS